MFRFRQPSGRRSRSSAFLRRLSQATKGKRLQRKSCFNNREISLPTTNIDELSPLAFASFVAEEAHQLTIGNYQHTLLSTNGIYNFRRGVERPPALWYPNQREEHQDGGFRGKQHWQKLFDLTDEYIQKSQQRDHRRWMKRDHYLPIICLQGMRAILAISTASSTAWTQQRSYDCYHHLQNLYLEMQAFSVHYGLKPKLPTEIWF